jgi:tRNA(Ile)-lysidine synthase
MQLKQLPQGTYVVGVSGGVDSAVLLHVLITRQPKNCYIVAHFNHGIRGEKSRHDAEFVHKLAERYGLDYELGQAELGPGASEARARTARYNFLRQCRIKYKANAIIMAHHQGDVLETMIINIMRGTGWRGLTSLRSHPGLIRPLLNVTKAEIYSYAKINNLRWNEDSTNTDVRYLRNFVRHKILAGIKEPDQQKLLKISERQNSLRKQISEELEYQLLKNANIQNGTATVQRYLLIMYPTKVAAEYLQELIALVCGARLQRPQAELALVFAKAAKPGKTWQPAAGVKLTVNRETLFVEGA